MDLLQRLLITKTSTITLFEHMNVPRDTPTPAIIAMHTTGAILSLVYNMMLVLRESRKKYFVHCYIPDVKFFDNLIGWTLANTGDATLEKKLSLFQCHPSQRYAGTSVM